MNTDVLVPVARLFVAEVNSAYPRRDHTSDGSIGDAAHQATSSDHNPGGPASPSPGRVDAVDIDEDLTKPNDKASMYRIIDAFEKHPSAEYWIYEGQIAERTEGWDRNLYRGSNPHTHHAHFNFRETKKAHNSTQPFGIKGETMSVLDESIGLKTDGEVDYSAPTTTVRGVLRSISYYVMVTRNRVVDGLAEVKTKLDALGVGLADVKRAVATRPAVQLDAQALHELTEQIRVAVGAEVRTALDEVIEDSVRSILERAREPK